MQQLLSGIAHMHSEWVIHRDLKTANLLLSHNNILKVGFYFLQLFIFVISNINFLIFRLVILAWHESMATH
jgi:cell division cycle 2-like protein